MTDFITLKNGRRVPITRNNVRMLSNKFGREEKRTQLNERLARNTEGEKIAFFNEQRKEARLNKVLRENKERRIKFDEDVSRVERQNPNLSQFKLQQFKNSLEFSRRYS